MRHGAVVPERYGPLENTTRLSESSEIPPESSHPTVSPPHPPSDSSRFLVAFAERWGFLPDSPLLRNALTHSSVALSVEHSNERLEFLGDALLSAFVARYLFDRLPPDTPEAVLTRARVQIVRRETLAAAGRALGLQFLLQVGQGERKEQRHHRDSLLADTYEAVIAALYLEAGEPALCTFLSETLKDSLHAVLSAPPEDDPKTRLQNHLQAEGRGLPHYATVTEVNEGAYHHFVVEVRDAASNLLGRGEGNSKRIAQRNAAENALHTVTV